MGLYTPDTQRLTAEQATQQGYRYVNGEWRNAKGDRFGVLPQRDPNLLITSEVGPKQILAAAGTMIGGGLGANAMLGPSTASGASAATSAAPTWATPSIPGGSMNFTDILKKIGDITGIAQNVGQVAGGAAEAKASTEQNQALLDTTRNSQLNQQYGTQQGAETDAGRLNLDRNKFDLDSEGTRMKRALIGALLGQVGSAPQGKFSIGDAAPTAALMASRAKEQALAGNTYQNGTVLTPPTLSQPKAGSGSGFLNNLALFSSLLGAGGAKPPDLGAKQ